MKIKPIYILLFIYLMLIAFLGISCNPVKQVLKDKEKLDKVAEVVIRSGYCSNDTIIKTNSDTTYRFDTIYEPITDTIQLTNLVQVPIVKTRQKTIIKTITIHDTIHSVITDNARLNAFRGDLAVLQAKYNDIHKTAKSRLNWLILILVAFSLYLLRKPIKRFILWHFSPMLK